MKIIFILLVIHLMMNNILLKTISSLRHQKLNIIPFYWLYYWCKQLIKKQYILGNLEIESLKLFCFYKNNRDDEYYEFIKKEVDFISLKIKRIEKL